MAIVDKIWTWRIEARQDAGMEACDVLRVSVDESTMGEIYGGVEINPQCATKQRVDVLVRTIKGDR